MIPVTVLVGGKAAVSRRIKGDYSVSKPPRFSELLRPIVFWNITYQCNLQCVHCYIKALAKRNPNELTTEEAKRVAEEIVEIGIPLVVFSGGEPLVRSDFWEIVEPMAGKQRPKLSLSTNGTLITRDVAEKLASYQFKYVGISIDSIKPEWHDRFRGVPGAFEAAVRGIKYVMELGIDVGVRTTLTKYNIEEVPAILKWAYDLGIKRVSLYVLDTVGRGAGIADWLPTHEQLRKFADTIIDEARKYSGEMEILIVRAQFLGIYIADKLARSPEDFMKYISLLDAQGNCGRKSISIYPNGDVKPCQFVDWVTLGNVRRQTLKDILSPENKELKPFLAIENYLRGPRCGRCPFRRICGGGSRGRALELTGDEWGDDPLCFIDFSAIAKKWGIDPNKIL
ncbi:radical SAM/SPASM domain-containing protein [Hyperthermus butylicus]|uniref:Fe-S oxidoreductase-metallo cofactor biosynthesis protein n=1 Tax=Hyperthermus butylicus (strain DSM 5456 / JCM 9403 / PLM1-5) TaxID=415426 RepID=A2BIS4_HYPBU|nr:radical SAM protein [Hyperthermus butylicus]ABM79915.1 Fe-S oxidoreductase - metallo cofactor biosynthesis protein [Hyperthermus butylicus DSM 5456]